MVGPEPVRRGTGAAGTGASAEPTDGRQGRGPGRGRRGDRGGNLYAYTLAGERLWRISASVHAEARLPVVGGVVTVIDRQQLLGIDVASSEERWRVYTSKDVEDPRAMGDDTFTDGTQVFALMELIDVDTGGASTHVVAQRPADGRRAVAVAEAGRHPGRRGARRRRGVR